MHQSSCKLYLLLNLSCCSPDVTLLIGATQYVQQNNVSGGKNICQSGTNVRRRKTSQCFFPLSKFVPEQRHLKVIFADGKKRIKVGKTHPARVNF
jgi:hypothetical protein